MGRLLTDTVVRTLREQIRLDFRRWTPDDEAVQPDDRVALARISADDPVQLEERSDSLLHVYATLPDIKGETALLLRADIPRDITAKGKTVLHYARISVMATVLVALLALLAATQRVILRPINKLVGSITHVGEARDLAMRLPAAGADELGTLARSVNRTLDELEQAVEARRKMEAHIQQAQKFESLNVMAGSIAHNFNNLLQVVLGHHDMILDDLPPDSPHRAALEAAGKAAGRAADLSTLMLTYVGHGQTNKQTLAMAEVVEGMMDMLKLPVSRKARLELGSSDSHAELEGDLAQIQQVIMNLVANAAEAIGDAEGLVSVTTGTRWCDPSALETPYTDEGLPEGDYAYLEVADTGCGMDQETATKALDPFFTTKFEGRGIGLAAVLGIVRAHKGAISMCSEPGRGTTVTVFFPASEAQPDAAEEVDASAASAPTPFSGTALLVEDEEMVRRVTRRMLERLGFQVLTTADGREAVDTFRQHTEEVRCVVLDLTMPRMDGVETLAELRRVRTDVPVVISTGHPEEEVRDRLVQARPAAVVHKPVRLAELRQKLEAALGEETP